MNWNNTEEKEERYLESEIYIKSRMRLRTKSQKSQGTLQQLIENKRNKSFI